MNKRVAQWIAIVAVGGLIGSIVMAKHEHHERKAALPDAIKAMIAADYAGATISEAEREVVKNVVYEIELELADGSEIELMVASNGVVTAVEKELSVSDLPFDLSSIMPQNAKIEKIESEVTHAVFAPVANSQGSVTQYEVEVEVDGHEVEYTLSASGVVLSEEVEDDDDDKHHGKKHRHKHHDRDDDDDDDHDHDHHDA